MPRAEVGTPKYIANKIKAKGLQKLRWYCQMCQKQCRDENGFKCHTMSESHQRQLLLFADAPTKYIDQFSDEFQDGYCELLRRRFGSRRVHANVVYQEYISDRDHLHMNATQWETLTDFVKYLGRTGKCTVDETEKGWYVTYIDRDPETIAKQKALEKKEKMDKDDEERMMDFIEKQVNEETFEKLNKDDQDTMIDFIEKPVERGKQASRAKESVYTDLQKDPEEKLSLHMSLKPSPSTTTSKSLQPSPLSVFKKPEQPIKLKKKEEKPEKRKASSALADIMNEQERQKEKANRKDNWITENIVVKVVTKALGDKYYKQKGVINGVDNDYTAVVKMIDCGHTLKLDQNHLETVIPAIGKRVKIVNGAYRGSVAILLSIDEKNFGVKIEIDEGPTRGRVLSGVSYDDISKLHVAS